MIIRLAFRNTWLYFPKRLPVALFLVGTMALLFVGNAILLATDQGLEQTYRQSLTADLAISAKSDDPFTLFGSDLPLIGEFFKNPTLPQYDDVRYRLSRSLPEAQALPLLIGAGKLSLERWSSAVPFFGANLGDYLRFFPGLKVIKGTIPTGPARGLFVNSTLYAQMSKRLGRSPEVGETFLFAAALESSFVLRELPLLGVYEYPASDELLDRVSLIDDDTARALEGYYGGATKAATAQGLESDSLDDLFSGGADQVADPNQGLTIEQVRAQNQASESSPAVDSTTWNFILIRQPGNLDQARGQLQSAFDRDRLGVEVRTWRDAAGGSARVVSFIQWIFNLGMVFISLVTALIVMNSFALSVAERTKELGTMRALGASQGKVAALIGFETILMVAVAALAGIVLGIAALAALGLAGGFTLTNPFLISLFGTASFHPGIPWPSIPIYVGLGLGLGLVSMVLPMVRVLRVSPVRAMARE